MKGTTLMSKIKRTLPEDFDATDPRDLSSTIQTNDEPSLVDWAIQDLIRAVAVLEDNSIECYAYFEELNNLAKRLNKVAQEADKPF